MIVITIVITITTNGLGGKNWNIKFVSTGIRQQYVVEDGILMTYVYIVQLHLRSMSLSNADFWPFL